MGVMHYMLYIYIYESVIYSSMFLLQKMNCWSIGLLHTDTNWRHILACYRSYIVYVWFWAYTVHELVNSLPRQPLQLVSQSSMMWHWGKGTIEWSLQSLSNDERAEIPLETQLPMSHTHSHNHRICLWHTIMQTYCLLIMTSICNWLLLLLLLSRYILNSWSSGLVTRWWCGWCWCLRWNVTN